MTRLLWVADCHSAEKVYVFTRDTPSATLARTQRFWGYRQGEEYTLFIPCKGKIILWFFCQVSLYMGDCSFTGCRLESHHIPVILSVVRDEYPLKRVRWSLSQTWTTFPLYDQLLFESEVAALLNNSLHASLLGWFVMRENGMWRILRVFDSVWGIPPQMLTMMTLHHDHLGRHMQSFFLVSLPVSRLAVLATESN